MKNTRRGAHSALSALLYSKMPDIRHLMIISMLNRVSRLELHRSLDENLRLRVKKCQNQERQLHHWAA